MNDKDSISMSRLLETVRFLLNNPNGPEFVDHLLMYPDDFIMMMKDDDLRDDVDVVNPQCRDETFMSDEEILGRGLCLLGLPIRTSEHVRPGKIFKVVSIEY